MRVIGVDQRGVLRSDDLPASPPLTVELLVDDVEALRRRLGMVSVTIRARSRTVAGIAPRNWGDSESPSCGSRAISSS